MVLCVTKMRLSSPELSESSTPQNPHRSKHRRRVPLSQSSTTQDPRYREQDEEDEYSRSYSPQDGDLAVGDEEETADDGSRLASYSGYPSSASAINSSATPAPHPPTYINVAPLPIFRGTPGECPVAHLARFERVCRANNAATAEMVSRIFPVTLDGEAALWYELAVEPHPSVPWDEVKSAFLRAYRAPDFADRSRAELMAIRQGDDEGVNAYHLRLQWILKKWPDHGIPDALLKGIFVDGLREDFQDWIVPQGPGSLEEAVRLAVSWEQARSVRAARRRSEAKCGFCEGPHEEGACEVRRRMRELWLRSKEEQEGSPALGRKEGGEEEDGMARVLSLRRRTQCQCLKHQCGKRLERSSSAVADGNPPTTE